jgi:hypothetical protein
MLKNFMTFICPYCFLGALLNLQLKTTLSKGPIPANGFMIVLWGI